MKLTVREQAWFRAYQAGMHVVLPLGILLGLPGLLLKAKRRRTLFRRLGFQRVGLGADRRSLWVHALSLGETLSCVALVRALRSAVPDRPLVLSVSTLTARTMAEERLRDVVDRIVFFPFDLVPSVRIAVRAINPALVVLVETDIWPGFQRFLRQRQIPEVLVNARLSPQSYRACLRLSGLFGPALNAFETVFPQSDGEAVRYRDVGLDAGKIGMTGNLKFDAAAADFSEESLRQLRASLGLAESDRVWVAGSTHAGEERSVLQIFREARAVHPQLQLILVPRHPHRGREVQALCNSSGLPASLWSEGIARSDSGVRIVDVMGKLAALYGIADMAFVGGSLVPKGGQNPIEPAAAAKPVLFGPDMSDFPDIAGELLSREAAFQVQNERQLGERVRQLLADPELGVRMGRTGRLFVHQHRGTTQRVVEWIQQRLGTL